MHGNDTILLVARATNIDDDLEYFLPLIKNKKGVIIATNWDRVKSKNAAEKLENLEQNLKVPIIPVDARKITESQKNKIFDALENPRTFSNKTFHTGISIKPKPTVLEKEHMGI